MRWVRLSLLILHCKVSVHYKPRTGNLKLKSQCVESRLKVWKKFLWSHFRTWRFIRPPKMSAGSGVSLDCDVLPAIQAFIKSGNLKKSEKNPWIIFDVGKKEESDCKECIRIVRTGKPEETYDDLVQILLETDTAYAVVDYPIDDGKKESTYLAFINWTKESAPVKKKMVASASVAPLKNILSNSAKVSIEGHDIDDICCEHMTCEVKKSYKVIDKKM